MIGPERLCNSATCRAMAGAAAMVDGAGAKVAGEAKALHAAWDAPCNNDACGGDIRDTPFWGACNNRGADDTDDDAAHCFQTRKTAPGAAKGQ